MPVSTPGAARRASYGPRSPVVGERGARTRQLLLDAALQQFAAQGFHATLVDDIARTAGVSRATLYQYFDSREEIVTELLEECGAALMRVARRVGQLSPTPTGFDNLHWWLGEWSYVYDKYATMFVEWAHIDSPQTPLRPLITGFVESYAAQLASRIEQADPWLPPEQVAIVLTTVIERFNYYRHTRDIGVSDRVALDTLAVVVQLLLFPHTPWPALQLHDETPPAAPARLPRQPLTARDQPLPRSLRKRPPAAEGAHPSVEALLAAGARVFSTAGYRSSNVDQILAEAGLSRRTFYKYFENRLDLLTVMSERAAGAVTDLADRVGKLRQSPQPGTALREWLADFLAFHREQGSVLRIWIEEPVDARETGDVAVHRLLDGFSTLLNGGLHPDGFDVTAASWLMLAVLERVPAQGVGTRIELADEQLVPLMAAFVERGLRGMPVPETPVGPGGLSAPAQAEPALGAAALPGPS
jgi:AcrR family transcriptional regulator